MNKKITQIEIDERPAEGAPFVHYWAECVGAGRAKEALRADWQSQFHEAVTKLGVKRVRFHGVFHDDMFVYRDTDGGGFGPNAPLEKPLYTFSYVDKVFDNILAEGAQPFVELSFMPSGMATQLNTLFWWRANCSPPVEMGKWNDLVRTAVKHWIERYGLAEVLTWKFEVWNEPNLHPFFWTGTKSQYFELYKSTAEVIKAIDPSLQVGGPSTSVFVPDDRYAGEIENKEAEVSTAAAPDVDALDWKPVWVEEFLEWCAARHVPVDFVTTHTYPTDYAFGANGESVGIFRNIDATRDDLTKLREIIRQSAYPDAEIHITEWSSSPSGRDWRHDSLYAATFIARSYLQCIGLAESLSYWTFSDIFEEGGPGIGPFHGGFGLTTLEGIHKPTYHVFEMLNRLGDSLLLRSEEGVVTTGVNDSENSIAALFFNYPDAMKKKSIGGCDRQENAFDLDGIGRPRQIHHSIGGLRSGDPYKVEILDAEHGDVLREWTRIGAPINPSREEVMSLKAAGEAVSHQVIQVNEQGILNIDLKLTPWAVASVWKQN